jgi:hypothetical protein
LRDEQLPVETDLQDLGWTGRQWERGHLVTAGRVPNANLIAQGAKYQRSIGAEGEGFDARLAELRALLTGLRVPEIDPPPVIAGLDGMTVAADRQAG